VLCPIYSDGDLQIARMLDSLPPLTGGRYLPARPRRSGRYTLHGYVIIPLAFRGEPSAQEIDFAPLRPRLASWQVQLSRVGL
jgi:hypothetical protein